MLTPRIFTALALAVLSSLTLSIGSDAIALTGAVHTQGQLAGQAAAPAACIPLTGPGQILAPTVLTFDDLPVGTSIGSFYERTHGVRFEESRTAQVITYDHPLPRSAPMTALSQTNGDPAATALNVYFNGPQASVGVFVGNGGGVTTARLQGFDAFGNVLCSVDAAGVPDGHTRFVGFQDPGIAIVSVSLTYLSTQAESLDDLHFSAVVLPTATPSATATATATATPTSTATPTRPLIPAASLFVFPTAAAPGGIPAVSGYGFPAQTALQLSLRCPGGAELDLGSARTDAAGHLRTTVVLPAHPPNPCILSARQAASTLAEADLTLLPALELSFAPQAGPPGTTVSFTVRNLVAGELRLAYAGRAVAGPLNVASGSYSGTFVVPADRPDPLGELAELRATNLILGRAIGEVTGAFRSQAAPPPPTYRVADLQLPPGTLPPGSDFVITGRISPAPQGAPSQFKVLPVWRKADGRTFPIGRGPAQVGADGSFSAPIRVPSLLTGDPTWPQNGDQAGVMLVTGANQPQPFLQAITGMSIFPTFNITVVDAATGQLIPSAKVSFEAWQGYQVSANSLPLGEMAAEAATGVSNQIGQAGGTIDLTDDEKAWIALMKAVCQPLTIPVNGDKWQLINPTLDQTLSEPSVQGLLLANSIRGETAAAAGQEAGAENLQAAAGSAAGDVIPYLLTVDALDAGYGLTVAEPDNIFTLKNLSLLVNFHLADLTYRDLKGNILANPYIVKLGKISSGDQSALGPIKVFLAGIGAPELPGPAALPRFTRYYSVKDVQPGVQVTKQADGSVQVTLSYAQFHKLGAGGMQLYIDDAWKANFAIKFNPGLACKNGTITWTSAPFYEGKAVIPNAHLLAAGSRALQVRAQRQSGQWVTYDYILQMDALPASWFAVKTTGTRTLTWRPGQVDLSTSWLKSETSTQLLHSDPAKTDETGQLDNRTLPTSNISQRAEANGHKGPQISGQLSGQTLNRYGQGCNLSNCPPNSAVAAAADPLAGHTYGPRTETVVPDITFDLPEVKYGIPFVAEVAAGGSLSYGATVTYKGSATVLKDGGVQSLLTIHPEAHTSATIYVEGRLLSGLIGRAGASLTADFDVHMPVTYDTAKSDPLTASAYFKYGADFKAWHKWGCVPYVGCAYSKEYPKPLFNGCEMLSGSGGCPAATSAGAAERVAAVDPPQFDLQLAASGQGAVLAIWQQTRTSLATSLFNGVAWTPAGNIATGLGSSQPQVAFLAPNRAVAVWTETNLSEAQLPGLGGEDLLRAQRIAYAVWDGASWSAAQPLTTPSLGEGGPALAACPAWQAGCPAGGAAVAVWERNVSADLEARAIRLYYARYQDGAWSAPQPVDGASAFTDILPQVAYINGVPLVVWVRDGDADLTDANSRRIALRFLDGGAVFMPAELPAAIAEVTLAVDGAGQPVLAFTRLEDPSQLLTNRRPLWAATVTCSGPVTCTWQPVQLTDPAGRTLYAEQPVLATTLAGQVIVTFRGTGFGGAGALPGDPAGMVSGQGELVQATLNTVTGQVAPKYLTQDAAVKWLPAATYDPLLGVSLATAVKGSAVAGAGPAAPAAGPQAGPAPDLPIAAAIAPDLPDFTIWDATVTGGPATGDPLRVAVQIANSGASWPGSAEQPLEIVAAWDGPPGLGAPAGLIGLTDLGTVPFVTIALDLAPPPAGLDAVHELYVAVNPGLAIHEAEAANNSLTLAVGGIAAPAGLWAQVEPGSPLVFLGWDAVPDRRVAGYRVYRAGAGGAWAPIGGSFAPGYVDLAATQGRTYSYALAAYTADGIESPMSPQVGVGAPPLQVYLPVVVRDR